MVCNAPIFSTLDSKIRYLTGMSSDDRREKRRAVRGFVGFRQPGERKYPASILDLSVTGCRVEFTKLVEAGQQVWIGLPGIENIHSTVRWSDGWIVGVEFNRPLHPSVLELVAGRIDDAE